MNAVKLEQRISELESQREREYNSYLRWLTDEQLQLMIDGLRASMRGEPIGEAAMAIILKRPFPPHRELTQAELTEVDRFVRGTT